MRGDEDSRAAPTILARRRRRRRRRRSHTHLRLEPRVAVVGRRIGVGAPELLGVEAAPARRVVHERRRRLDARLVRARRAAARRATRAACDAVALRRVAYDVDAKVDVKHGRVARGGHLGAGRPHKPPRERRVVRGRRRQAGGAALVSSRFGSVVRRRGEERARQRQFVGERVAGVAPSGPVPPPIHPNRCMNTDITVGGAFAPTS